MPERLGSRIETAPSAHTRTARSLHRDAAWLSANRRNEQRYLQSGGVETGEAGGETTFGIKFKATEMTWLLEPLS
jgi:hypothetical protein